MNKTPEQTKKDWSERFKNVAVGVGAVALGVGVGVELAF